MRARVLVVLGGLVLTACVAPRAAPVAPVVPARLPPAVTGLQAFADGTVWVAATENSYSAPEVFLSRDGGVHWTKRLGSEGAGQGQTYIHFFDSRSGLVAWAPTYPYGPGMIWSTADAGAHWARTSADFGPSWNLVVFFRSLSEGWRMPGPSAVEHTTDGGRTWTAAGSLPAGYPGEQRAGIGFSDALHGWVVTNQSDQASRPVVYVTGDGGKSWSRVLLAVPPGAYPGFLARLAPVESFVGGAAAVVLTVGEGSMGVGAPESVYVYRSQDAGLHWGAPVRIWSGKVALEGIPVSAIAGASDWWLAVGSRLSRTRDAGAVWTPMPVPLEPPWEVSQIRAVGSTVYLVAFRTGTCPNGAACAEVLRSDSAGARWTVM